MRRVQPASSIFPTQSNHLNLRHREGARPLKWGRIALHLGGGLLAAALITESAMPMSWQGFTFSFAGVLLVLDFLRFSVPKFNLGLVKRLEWFAQEHEANRLTSATWFWLAMSVVALAGDRSAYLATLVTLSVGDPAGSIVGRKVRSPTLVHGRTVGGTLAFFLAASLMVGVLFLRLPVDVSTVRLSLVVMGASALGALIELYTAKLDDNLTVGLGVGLVYVGCLSPGFAV